MNAEVRGDATTGVVDAVLDSRHDAAGALFFCVVGEHHDGHDHAAAAVASGAVALAVERWLGLEVPQARVHSVRSSMGPMSSAVHGDPSAALSMVGVTGTNGKTTTTHLVESILRHAGRRCGSVGTTGARVAGEPVMLARTTPEAPDLQRLLATMRDSGVTAVVMEVSSHALALRRVDAIAFDVCVFTNLSQDHLDFHASMDAYFQAKAELFRPSHTALGVVNVDDAWGRRLASEASVPTVGFAVERQADLRAADVVADRNGVVFTVDGVRIRSKLKGAFNVYNCLAALAAARALEIDVDDAAEGIERLDHVPGRMEPIDAGQEFLVMVDYAHTPDSIHGVLGASRPLTTGRLIVVLGCGGDRDRAKRPAMGREATSAADLTVLTTDNPRSEDPLAILADIELGATQGGGAYLVEPDRRDAIRQALEQAAPGDTVIIAGKGHETIQELGKQSVPFDDRVVAHEELRALLERT